VRGSGCNSPGLLGVFVGSSRSMTRECQVRFCERLGVKFPGPTRHFRPSWSGLKRSLRSAMPSIAAEFTRHDESSPKCRVEMWRGGCKNISVSASFVWRCLSGATMTPFPHPAHRTGHEDFPHPALGQDFTPSPAARHRRMYRFASNGEMGDRR
jgi:hypothetical protein